MRARKSHICLATAHRVSPSSRITSQGAEQLQPATQVFQQAAHAPASLNSTFAISFGMYLLTAAPAVADVADAAGTPFQGVTANSLYVTLALFLMTAPGTHAACQGCVLAC